MKKIIYTLITIAFIACGTVQQPASAKYNPQFNYTPEKRDQITDNSMTIAIIDPVFSDGENNNLVAPYKNFVRSMADDIEESLNAQGYKIKGPYKTRDEMVYGDKLNSSFALEIEIQLYSETGTFSAQTTKAGLTAIDKVPRFRLAGDFYHEGNIILTATDPLDGEKFWKKTVPLNRKKIVVNGEKVWQGQASAMTEEQMMTDMGVYNPIAKVLEEYYAEAMRTVATQFDTREMSNISQQIEAKRIRVGQ